MRADGIRCPTPDCNKKLGEYLEGIYRNICPRCGRPVEIEWHNGCQVRAEVGQLAEPVTPIRIPLLTSR